MNKHKLCQTQKTHADCQCPCESSTNTSGGERTTQNNPNLMSYMQIVDSFDVYSALKYIFLTQRTVHLPTEIILASRHV